MLTEAMRELSNPRAPKFTALIERLFHNPTDALFDQVATRPRRDAAAPAQQRLTHARARQSFDSLLDKAVSLRSAALAMRTQLVGRARASAQARCADPATPGARVFGAVRRARRRRAARAARKTRLRDDRRRCALTRGSVDAEKRGVARRLVLLDRQHWCERASVAASERAD